MTTVLGLLQLFLYVVAILAVSAAVTMLVIKISPTKTARQTKT